MNLESYDKADIGLAESLEIVDTNKLLDLWEQEEGHVERWTELAHERGFLNWREWRKSYLQKFGLTDVEWEVFNFDISKLAEFMCGPYKGWVVQAENVNKTYFKDLTEAFVGNPKVESMIENFPNNTLVTLLTDGERVMVLEGNHRAMAVTMGNVKDVNAKAAVTMVTAEQFDSLRKEGHLDDYSGLRNSG